MPKYLVLAQSFIGNTLVEGGTEIEYDGVPGANLEPLDAAAEKAVKAAAKAGGGAVPSTGDTAAAEKRADEAEATAKEATDRADALEAELAEAKATIAKFDKDGDGKPGGSKAKDDKALA